MRLVAHLGAVILVSAFHLRTTQVVDVDAKPPLPPGIQVIITLAAQYFIVYLALQLAQTQAQMKTPGSKSLWQKTFEEAALTVDFCPMLGVLFLAVRMRAQQLWPPNGKVPVWGQTWMWMCSFGILCGTLTAIGQGIIGGGPSKKSYGNLGNEGPILGGSNPRPRSMGLVGNALYFINVAGTVLIYIGFVTVVLVLYDLQAPPGSSECSTCTWTYLTPVAPAVECTINLTVQFFGVQLALKIAEGHSKWLGRDSAVLRILKDSKSSLKLCPMLAVLFIGARMRALQMNLASPPVWAQLAFYAATYACLAQTLCAICIPLATGETNATRNEDGEVKTTASKKSGLGNLLAFVQMFSLLVLIAGVVVSGYAVFAMEASFGDTPPVSTTLLCVLNLTGQFLIVSIFQIVAQLYSSLMLGGVKTDLNQVLNGALPTMAYIPMLCVLFVAVRMRALQLNTEGAPQHFVQRAMEVCTWCMLAQTICAITIPFTTGELQVHVDVPYLTKIINATKYVCVGLTFGGIILTVYGVMVL